MYTQKTTFENKILLSFMEEETQLKALNLMHKIKIPNCINDNLILLFNDDFYKSNFKIPELLPVYSLDNKRTETFVTLLENFDISIYVEEFCVSIPLTPLNDSQNDLKIELVEKLKKYNLFIATGIITTQYYHKTNCLVITFNTHTTRIFINIVESLNNNFSLILKNMNKQIMETTKKITYSEKYFLLVDKFDIPYTTTTKENIIQLFNDAQIQILFLEDFKTFTNNDFCCYNCYDNDDSFILYNKSNPFYESRDYDKKIKKLIYPSSVIEKKS